jgi:hypothetical protein
VSVAQQNAIINNYLAHQQAQNTRQPLSNSPNPKTKLVQQKIAEL